MSHRTTSDKYLLDRIGNVISDVKENTKNLQTTQETLVNNLVTSNSLLTNINNNVTTTFLSGEVFNQSIVQGTTYTSSAIDWESYKDITLYGNVNQTAVGNSVLAIELSNDNVNWIEIERITGELTNVWSYFYNLRANTKYLRLKYISDVNGTLKINYALK